MTDTRSSSGGDAPRHPLLPCPFCGGKAAVERQGTARQSSIIACEDCGGRLETGEIWSIGDRWNTRTPALPSGQADHVGDANDMIVVTREMIDAGFDEHAANSPWEIPFGQGGSFAAVYRAMRAVEPRAPTLSGQAEIFERCAKIAEIYGIGRERASYGGSDIAVRIRADAADFLATSPTQIAGEVREALTWRLAYYDHLIEQIVADEALTETAKSSLIAGCESSKSAIQLFAEDLRRRAALSPQAQAGEEPLSTRGGGIVG